MAATLTSMAKKIKSHAKVIKELKEKKESATTARDKHNKTLQMPSATLIATTAMTAAKEACAAKVDAIVEECLANNRRFRDSKFDLLNDRRRCLYSSLLSEINYESMDGVKRVGEIFRNPVFYLDGANPDDIKQGAIGDCWHLASLATLANIPGLIEQLCVKKNERVGVYGFIFFKDGDWVSTVVDDQLCYKIDQATLKKSLYFSSCSEERETWLPLLEKAYAKIHGDYESLSGGFSSEGTEDLTGGVASILFTNDILDVDQFWDVEMKRVNKQALMGCSIDHDDPAGERHGIMPRHAYSVLSTATIQGERIVQVRNPWGKTEWNGDWSDQSDKWTPEAIAQVNMEEKDDGKFWMSYKDFLRVFDSLDLCRIFDATWSVASSWIPYNVEPRSSGKFHFELDQASEAVIVLSQPDTRYYGALKTDFVYTLSFHVYNSDDKLVKRARATVPYCKRSVSVELNLPVGQYTVVPHVTREATGIVASDDEDDGVEDSAVGPSAHLSGVVVQDEEAVTMNKSSYLFQQRKASMVRSMSMARVAGKRLLGVDDDDYEEVESEEVAEANKWELMLGLRVYSHDPTIHLTGVPGEHPALVGEEEEELVGQDPEDVTATLAGKVEEEEWETDDEEEEEEEQVAKKKKGKKGKKGKKEGEAVKEE